MKIKTEYAGQNKAIHYHPVGQSLVEFALILPLFVLFIIGIFDLGRAFFSFIAITNAAREGTRVITFWPGKTTGNDVVNRINYEIGNSPLININNSNITSRKIYCWNGGATISEQTIGPNALNCDSGKPVRVSVTYNFAFILKFFFPNDLSMTRTAEMMAP